MQSKATRQYFAYGSNMVREQMYLRCPGTQVLGIAKLRGYRFIINQQGVATIIPAVTQAVYGVLWKITPGHEQTLDDYEGLDDGWYYKTLVDIESPTTARQQAMIYIACDQKEGEPLPGYLEEIIAAAEDLFLPAGYIQELRTWLRQSS
jgi:hypothetical protein